jgi:hypothetical protein
MKIHGNRKVQQYNGKKLMAPTLTGHNDASKTLFRIHAFTNARIVEE